MSKIKGTATDDGEGPAQFERAQPKAGFNLETPQPRATGEAQSAKLKSMIAGLKKSND
jgi:hypothetical protein